MSASSTILVVDDHADLAENLAEILGGAGYETLVAGSAEEALERLDARVAALLTDFRLPGLTGAELIVEVRRRGLGIPAVVMSAYTDDETIVRAHRAGATHVLAKPVAIQRLMETISSLLPPAGGAAS
jgi:DNA-binding NtrC family response regulator